MLDGLTAGEELSALLHGTAGFQADALHHYDTLADRPGLERIGERMWACTSYAAAVEVLGSPDFHVAPPPAPDDGTALGRIRNEWVELQTGERHRQARRAAAPALSRAEASVTEAVAEAIEVLPEQGARCDLMPSLIRPAVAKLVCRLLGVPEELLPQIVPLMSRVAGSVTSAAPGADAERAAATLARLLDENRPAGTPSALTVAQTVNLFVAASPLDTLVGEHVAAAFGGPGASRDRLDGDARHASEAAAETARLDPPQMIVPRTASVATEILGRRIAAGEKVLVVVGVANRDGARGDGTSPHGRCPSLSFGFGDRTCLGRTVALRTAAEVVNQLTARYRTVELAPPVYGAQPVMRWLDSLPAVLRA